jgi:phage recombination protein Bet
MNQQAVATIEPRLRMPATVEGVDSRSWRVLCDAIFPTARSPDAIVLALDYCRVRKLDVMKKPVNIVPMWSSALNRTVETIWPSILEVEITAARTGAWAGMDPPQWGEEIELTLEGDRTVWRNRVETKEHEKQVLKVPSWCSVTVYRIVEGERYAFTEPVYWEEAYGHVGNTPLANDMWRKRRRMQLHKVAKAASLRAAFPEEGEHTAEEMEGQTIDVVDESAPPPPAAAPPATLAPRQVDPPHDPQTGEVMPPHKLDFIDDPDTHAPETWQSWGSRFIVAVKTADAAEQIDQWEKLNEDRIAEMKRDAPKVQARLAAAVNAHRTALGVAASAEPEGRRPEQ